MSNYPCIDKNKYVRKTQASETIKKKIVKQSEVEKVSFQTKLIPHDTQTL